MENEKDIELRAIKYRQTPDRTAYAFDGRLYIKGKYVADVSNDGKKDECTITPRDEQCREVVKKAEIHCAKLTSQREVGPDLEKFYFLSVYSSLLMHAYLEKKFERLMLRRIERKMPNHLVWGNLKDERFSSFPFDKPITEMLKNQADSQLLVHTIKVCTLTELKEGEKILNLNIPEGIYKVAGLKPKQYTLPTPVKPKKEAAKNSRKTKGI